MARYNRQLAVGYAYKYALTPNPAYNYFSLDHTGGDCANFLSQCLYAGGIGMTSKWWYKGINSSNARWSVSWAVAHSLYWLLRTNASTSSTDVKGIELSSPTDLLLGDLVFYENSNRRIFHSAIVTGFAGQSPLISQHSYEALNISYVKPWSYFKPHFIRIEY